MPLVLVISSYVAGSRVGGGLAPYVLAPVGVDAVHTPTTLFGRHPGWGAPGGAPVAAEILSGMLEGVEANGLFSLVDVVLTGYFASAQQVAVAAAAIDRIRAAPRGKAHRFAPERPLVLVDAVIGDWDRGLYVSEATAAAIAGELAPRADLLSGNLFEIGRIAAADLRPDSTVPDIVRAIGSLRRDCLATSIRRVENAVERVGALLVGAGAAALADAPLLHGDVPKGTGDLLKLAFAGAVASGHSRETALARSVGSTVAIAERALSWRSPELPVAACFDLLRSPPDIAVRKVALT